MQPNPSKPLADFAPVTLSGARVRLVPLAPEHNEGLVSAVRDGELWNLWYTSAPEPENMAAEIARRLALQQTGSMIPFTVLDAAGKIVGMTTYMNIDHTSPRVEIGYTWCAKSAQRTGLNTEAKLLLLTHAFENLNCIAVEFRTHIMNHQSRRAIERLGAKLDGILRNQAYARNGTLRDTVVYSIIAGEWSVVKSHLDGLIARPHSAGR